MIKKLMKKFKNERGLTLVELLAVIVILAIVSAIAFVMIGNVMDNAKKDAHIANAQQVIAAAKLYDVSDSEELNESITSDVLADKGYLDDLINPWSKKIDEDYKGTVTKTVEEDTNKASYTIKFKGNSCDIKEGTKEEQLAQGREEVCK